MIGTTPPIDNHDKMQVPKRFNIPEINTIQEILTTTDETPLLRTANSLETIFKNNQLTNIIFTTHKDTCNKTEIFLGEWYSNEFTKY